MKSVTEAECLQNPERIFQQACSDPIVIRRSPGRDVVLMSRREFDSLHETLHLLGTPANALHLARSIAEYRQDGPGSELKRGPKTD